MIYRKAIESDLKSISQFTDYWLAGRGLAKGAPGAVNDYFIGPSQHRKYVLKYKTLLALEGHNIVAWAVVEPSGTLIHLLVAGDRRGQGIGSMVLRVLDPPKIRSKLDQSSGNPEEFYHKLGYKKVAQVQSQSRYDIDTIRPDRPKNIDIFEKIR